jgi:hypothetical protein
MVLNLGSSAPAFARQTEELNRAQTDELIRASFGQLGLPGLTVVHVECRALICKTEMTFPSAEADNEITRQVLLDPDSELMKDRGVIIPSRTTEDDGSVSAILCFYGRDLDLASL